MLPPVRVDRAGILTNIGVLVKITEGIGAHFELLQAVPAGHEQANGSGNDKLAVVDADTSKS